VVLSESQGAVMGTIFALFPSALIYFISFYSTLGKTSLKTWNSFRFHTWIKVVWPKPCV